MRLIKSVLLLTLTLSGCTTVFTHTTQAPTEFDRELYECQREAAPVQDRSRSNDMIERCLAIKGWRKSGYAWWFDRSAIVAAQPRGHSDDLKTSRADSSKIAPANARDTTRSAAGATKTYGGGTAGSLSIQPSEPGKATPQM